MIKKWILVTLTAFTMFYGCTSFDIGFLVQPAQPPSQKKPETSPPPQKAEPVETTPPKEIVEKPASPPAQPAGSETSTQKPQEPAPAEEKSKQPVPSKAPSEETAPEKDVAKATPPEEKLKQIPPEEIKPSTEVKGGQEAIPAEKTDEKTTSQKKGHETLVIAGIVTIEKNEYFIFDPSSKVRYRLVGLKKEEKDALQKQIGKMVKAEVEVLETQSAKAYNTQLVRFL